MLATTVQKVIKDSFVSETKKTTSNHPTRDTGYSEDQRTSHLKKISRLANTKPDSDDLRHAVDSYIGRDVLSQSSTLTSQQIERKNDLLDLALEFHLDGNKDAPYHLGRWIGLAASSGTIGIDQEQDFYNPKLISSQSTFVYFITRAAEDGREVAKFALGKWHAEGSNGVKQDPEKAAGYLRESAAQGYERAAKLLAGLPKSDFMLARECENSDPKKAITLYKQAASSGDNRAMFRLGELHLTILNDHDNAIKYFTMAKQSGHVDAPFQLAEIYATQYKQCIAKFWNSDLRDKALENYALAIAGDGQFAGVRGPAWINRLVFKADHCEDRDARYELGKFYLANNATEAEKYLRQAAEAGHADAAYILCKEHGDTNSSFLAYNSASLASHFRELAVKNGHPLAVLEKAAEGGDASALFHLYKIHSEGDPSISLPADQAKAQKYLFEAADKGDIAAINTVFELKKMGSIDGSIGSTPDDEYFTNLAFKQLKAQANAVTKKATKEYKVTVEAEAKSKAEAKIKEEAKLREEAKKQEEAQLAAERKSREHEQKVAQRLEAQFLNKEKPAKVKTFNPHQNL